MSLHNYGDEIKKSSELLRSSANSSSSNLSGTKVNIRKSPFNSLDNIRNFEDNMTMTRKPSQITTIHENKITDSFVNINSNTPTNANFVRRDSNGSLEYINSRSRTKSCENFTFNINRNQRNNSIPNKGLTNYPYSTTAHALSNENVQNYVNVPPLNSSSKICLMANDDSRKSSNATEDSRICSLVSDNTESTKYNNEYSVINMENSHASSSNGHEQDNNNE